MPFAAAANTLSSSISLLSAIPKLPFSSSSSPFPILRSFSPQLLSLSLHKHYPLPLPLTRHLRSLSPSNDAVSSSNDDAFEDSPFEDEDDDAKYEDVDAESDGQDFGIDVDALEREAKDAVREYSSLLARELIIRKLLFFIKIKKSFIVKVLIEVKK